MNGRRGGIDTPPRRVIPDSIDFAITANRIG